jgi:hypothetical protein
MESFSSGDFQITPIVEPDVTRLVWTGRGSMRDPRSLLVPYFQQVFAAARGAVEMHLVGLAACNSATIAAVIDAIRLAREHALPISVVYDGSLRWQRTSFEALRMFGAQQAFTLRAA